MIVVFKNIIPKEINYFVFTEQQVVEKMFFIKSKGCPKWWLEDSSLHIHLFAYYLL